MWNLFNKKKKKVAPSLDSFQKVFVKPLDYHPKIILAWAKAIEGNTDLSKFLLENDYEELNIAAAAIHLKQEARNWLMKNGYPHLMAMINAAEGDAGALKWLKVNDFEILAHIAQAVDDEKDSWTWLNQNTTPDIFFLTQCIKRVKDNIEENHNDVHSFGKD